MSDIEFKCNKCGQQIAIEEAGAGITVQCPKCGRQLDVPSLESKESEPAGPVINIERRSPWSISLRIIGVICLLAAVVGFFVAQNAASDRESWKGFAAGDASTRLEKMAHFNDLEKLGNVLIGCGIVGGLQGFLFAFLIDVLTDIRWFLKRLVDKTRRGAS